MSLTAPRLITFAVSLLLLAVVIASWYGRLPIPRVGKFIAEHRQGVLIAAWSVLALGVLSRRL